MKVLILSCNTGEGHNSAGKAVKEAVERAGHEAVMMDMMILAGPRTSVIVGGSYVKIVKYIPRLFQMLYRQDPPFRQTGENPRYITDAR